ncbi:co-regulatory protein PtrA N-terminal domain-containing protein [Pseudomonas amygdali]|uniref:Uncharacterized protein n=1 Tax=Pseudomonas amygdali pv. lachrymans str. M301315 TaxID=629260 RepID=A0AAD0V9C9_PSEAV|nr:co-regulatory protein PtrA N-terminal domain-containing protein [Pseudomonas amygdali]AXH59840.1 hypothetical protein PLA107_031955 [Pseudomonas amygdali pv. lachrymans str. M301315]
MKSYAPIIALVAAAFAQSALAEGGGDTRSEAMRQATEKAMAQYRVDHTPESPSLAPTAANQTQESTQG